MSVVPLLSLASSNKCMSGYILLSFWEVVTHCRILFMTTRNDYLDAFLSACGMRLFMLSVRSVSIFPPAPVARNNVVRYMLEGFERTVFNCVAESEYDVFAVSACPDQHIMRWTTCFLEVCELLYGRLPVLFVGTFVLSVYRFVLSIVFWSLCVLADVSIITLSNDKEFFIFSCKSLPCLQILWLLRLHPIFRSKCFHTN